MTQRLACVGCGFCCTSKICRIGAMIYGHYKNPCPALVWSESRYLCTLYLQDPDRYAEALDIAEGCCFPANPWRDNVIQRST